MLFAMKTINMQEVHIAILFYQRTIYSALVFIIQSTIRSNRGLQAFDDACRAAAQPTVQRRSSSQTS